MQNQSFKLNTGRKSCIKQRLKINKCKNKKFVCFQKSEIGYPTIGFPWQRRGQLNPSFAPVRLPAESTEAI